MTISSLFSSSLICLMESSKTHRVEGLPRVLGNKGTSGKHRRAQGNMTLYRTFKTVAHEILVMVI